MVTSLANGKRPVSFENIEYTDDGERLDLLRLTRVVRSAVSLTMQYIF